MNNMVKKRSLELKEARTENKQWISPSCDKVLVETGAT
jgi:hypothetical protein